MPMSSEGSVSRWIGELKAGDPAAAECLWGRYFEQLVGLARSQLRGTPRRAADEEDVALRAFDSFCRGAERGAGSPSYSIATASGRLLVTITVRKANALRSDERRQKRGGGEVVSESELPDMADSLAAETSLEQAVGREPTPELAAQVAEECRRLLGRLGHAALQSLALWKMEGYTNDELAARLGWGLRTVERKLRLIRTLWKEERRGWTVSEAFPTDWRSLPGGTGPARGPTVRSLRGRLESRRQHGPAAPHRGLPG
jgi:DNA-directed RNA polymerase specialized sigma24 family protein